MRIHWRLSILTMLTALFLSGFLVSPAAALTISPVKLELEADPGQTIGGTFELYNEELVARTVFVTYENFEPSGDLGTPRFVGNDGGLATWMTATPEVTLAPDQRIAIPYTITVPSDAKPGGYFAAIFYGATNPNAEAGEVAIGGKLGLLVLLRVRGDITEEGGINSFATVGEDRLHTTLPITLVTSMTNRGGDRIVPRGSVTIKNMFGGTVATLPVNEIEGSILPNSSRSFTTVWGTGTSTSGFVEQLKAQWADITIGWYNAEVNLVWGAEGNVSTASFGVFVLPWQLLVTVLGALGMLIVLLKSYNRFIISRARP